MFDIDKAIAEWRRHARESGVANATVLDELEAHLLDSIDQQMISGLSAEQAFHIAVQQIGSATSIKREFNKTTFMHPAESKAVKSVGVIGFAIYALISIRGLFSDWVSATQTEKLLGLAAVSLTGVLLFVSAHMWRIVPAVTSARLRVSVGIGSAVFCALLTACIFNFVMPRFDLTQAQVIVATLWALQPLVIGGAVYAGLIEASERRITIETYV